MCLYVVHKTYRLLDTRGPIWSNTHMTGLELKVQRVASEVRSKEIARVMGVDPSRITHIEASRKVTPETVRRYLAALSMCTTTTTEVA